MEKNHKNQNAVFLMVVGVIFIIVAGAIFVTTTWKHLPMIGKQIILFGVTIGLFFGSQKVRHGGRLHKTEIALFYMGVSFLGFFTTSVLNCMNDAVEQNEIPPHAVQLLVANLIMMIPMLWRFLKTRKGLDFSILILLFDGVILWGIASSDKTLDWSILAFCYAQMGIILLMALGDYHREKWLTQNKGLDIGFSIFYLIHVIRGACFLWIGILGELREKIAGVVLAMVLAVAAFLSYQSREKAVYRVFNSLFTVWCVLVGVDLINFLLPETVRMSIWGILFVSYVINLGIMVYMFRKELAYVLVSFGLLIPFAQLISYGIYDFRFSYVAHKHTVYIPFTVCMMLAVAVLVKRWADHGILPWQEQGKRIMKAMAVQTITVVVLLQAAHKEGFLAMGFHILVMNIFLMAAILKKKKGVGKAILYTFSLSAGELALLSQPYFDIPYSYSVEWGCFLVGIGVVLLQFIWYDRAKGIKTVSFVLNCILLAVLLLHDMVSGGIGNVILLGVTGVILLVVAAVLNHRKYVIAASVTLILLVLYITRNFWLSIAWWVYLFAAGVVLVTLAVKKESEERK